jgi:PAP2 superfamily protein
VILAGTLLWKVGRGLVEGQPQLAAANARRWLSLERFLHFDVEAGMIRAARDTGAEGVLRTAYLWLHYPMIALFLATALLFAPRRFPRVRTAFLLGHLPALLLIALVPMAPPRWLPELPFAEGVPSADALAQQGRLANETATLVGFHVGYAAFVAAGTIWLARGRLRYLILAYPAFVLVVVLGTGNHYLLDGLVGILCFAVGAAGAWALHNRQMWVPRSEAAARAQPSET